MEVPCPCFYLHNALGAPSIRRTQEKTKQIKKTPQAIPNRSSFRWCPHWLKTPILNENIGFRLFGSHRWIELGHCILQGPRGDSKSQGRFSLMICSGPRLETVGDPYGTLSWWGFFLGFPPVRPQPFGIFSSSGPSPPGLPAGADPGHHALPPSSARRLWNRKLKRACAKRRAEAGPGAPLTLVLARELPSCVV